MNDLLLWKHLKTAEFPVEEIIALLHDLAKSPLNRRFAFLPRIETALGHEEPRVRAAAAGVLGGMCGPLAFVRLVPLLDDLHPQVIEAAVAALAESAKDDPARMAHAVFHKNPKVRKAALECDLPKDIRWWSLFLLADSFNTPAAEKVVLQGEIPGHALPAMTEFVYRKTLSRRHARRLIALRQIKDLDKWLARGPARDDRQAHQLQCDFDPYAVSTSTLDNLDPYGRDILDEVFDLFWDADIEGERDAQTGWSPGETFFEEMIAGVRKDNSMTGRSIRQRVLASLLAVSVRRGGWIEPAVRLATAADPEFLLFRRIPVETRRLGASVLYRYADNFPRWDNNKIGDVLTTDICRRPSGRLDLWVIGAAMHLSEDRQPIRRLLEWAPLIEVINAFKENPYESAWLFKLTDRSARGRLYLIEQIRDRSETNPALLAALLIQTVHADGYDFLKPLTCQQAIAVLGHAILLGRRGGYRLSANKARSAGRSLGNKLLHDDGRHWEEFLQVWLNAREPERVALGQEMFSTATRSESATAAQREGMIRQTQQFASSAPVEQIAKFLRVVEYCDGLPINVELQIVDALSHCSQPLIQDWVGRRRVDLARREALVSARPPTALDGVVRTISTETQDTIAHAPGEALTAVLTPWAAVPHRGLAVALARRPPTTEPSLTACLALLGSHDPLPETDEQFARYSPKSTTGDAFTASFETAVVDRWANQTQLPLVGHAWLHRWEKHAWAVGEEMKKTGVLPLLQAAQGLKSDSLSQRIWEAAASVFRLWRYRQRNLLEQTFAAPFGRPLIELLTDALKSSHARQRLLAGAAAKMLLVVHQTGVAPEELSRLKSRVRGRLADASEEVRSILRPWIPTEGLPPPPKVASAPSPNETLLQRIETSDELDWLSERCWDDYEITVQAAARRLLSLGRAGAARILAALWQTPAPPCAMSLAATVSAWPVGEVLDGARRLVRENTADPEVCFRIGLGLIEQGNVLLEHVLAAACRPSQEQWFRPEDWTRLASLAGEDFPLWRLACGLAASVHPHAYVPAISQLTQTHWNDYPDEAKADAAAALRRFLFAGDQRERSSRMAAAWWLHQRHEDVGFPLLFQVAAEEDEFVSDLLPGMPDELIEGVASAALIAGRGIISDLRLFRILKAGNLNPLAKERALHQIVVHAERPIIRRAVLRHLPFRYSRTQKLRRVAETFAWGVRMGRELTSRLFSIEMISGDDLGYTRLQEQKIYISPLPILRREQLGAQVVEALILHEYGHHMYHSGSENQEVWRQAENLRLQKLLNLVSDEHLERNLRALDRRFGDRLKRLAAYAFQHSSNEIAVDVLLDLLQGRAFEVLTVSNLKVARKAGCVKVENGQVLVEMERSGASFARFVRALRMGLGNRHDDPKVEQGLALFRGKFRKKSMPQLLEIAKKLQEIFGDETNLLDSFGQDAVAVGDSDEMDLHGEGISNDEVQSEVRRINDPKQLERKSEKDGGGAAAINVSAEEDFTPITSVTRLPYDRAAHAQLAQPVLRDARRMRRYLQSLGVGLVAERRRLAGRRVDSGRIRELVLRSDPRVLIARRIEFTTDLFIGVVIDCSGSMSSGNRMKKAKMFGALLAEAARNFPGVDLRIFGFTDCEIFDAGDARRPAVAALEADGGNNDAAGLWHAAQQALASRRKAKLLVMISDGLPTQCSVAALSGLVRRLTNRMKMCCAQVAVAPLEEICFPHYVLLDEADLGASTRRFGELVAKLVRKVLKLT